MIENKITAILNRRGVEKRPFITLDNFKLTLAHLNHPEKSTKSIVIGGTNGKGTTTLFISNALRKQGYKIFTYLSPHLQSITERFLGNLIPIAPNALLALAEKYEPVAEKFNLSYFEFLTLLFFLWTQNEKPDYIVLEVGLGGRLDATNVTAPLAFALTNIAYDHKEYLGESLEGILKEKIHIAQSSSLFVSGVEQPELINKIKSQFPNCLFISENEIVTDALKDVKFKIPSSGTAKNAKLAYLLIQKIFPEIPLITIQCAFEEVINPGRMERICEKPVVYLSGDHNPAGVQSLIESLEILNIKKPNIVCAFSPDKPYQEMYDALKTISGKILLTQITQSKHLLKENYFSMGPFEVDPKAAVKKLMSQTNKNEVLIVTGSLYLIGEVRSLWASSVSFL